VAGVGRARLIRDARMLRSAAMSGPWSRHRGSICLALLVGVVVGCSAGTSPTPTAATAGTSVAPAGSATGSPLAGCRTPQQVPDLAAISALDPAARLACFGGSALSFTASIGKPIEDCGVGPVVEPRWFCLPGVFLVAPDSSAGAGASLPAYWDPSSGLTTASFPADQTVTITGHFDDAAAANCHVVGSSSPASDVVLACREAFVVTAVH